MDFQGVTQHGEFVWCGGENTFEEVVNLGSINREKSKAGVQMFPTLIGGALYRTS